MRTRFTAACVLAAALLGGCSLGGDDDTRPQLGAKAEDENAFQKLGFPSIATANTLRIGGGDAAADAAGAAAALFPGTDSESRPDAVVLVDKSDWQGAVAASVLAGEPIGAPLLISDGDDLPAVTEDALKRLAPRGSDLSRDAQVIRVGSEPPAPKGLKSFVIGGSDPYETAAALDRQASRTRGKPSEDVLVVSGERPEFAVPAGAWSARSGDSVLFVKKEEVPRATTVALREHERPDIFVLGPESVIGKDVVNDLERLGRVTRVQGRTPVENAIAFARFDRRGFGWGITVPGHNFTLANTSRALDAAAAAGLGANGVFAPLLLTDRTDELPERLEGYFLDVQPGYEDDPGLAVYNRVIVLGDDETISLDAQGRLNEVTRLIPVRAENP